MKKVETKMSITVKTIWLYFSLINYKGREKYGITKRFFWIW